MAGKQIERAVNGAYNAVRHLSDGDLETASAEALVSIANGLSALVVLLDQRYEKRRSNQDAPSPRELYKTTN